jgi:hypothetical protein
MHIVIKGEGSWSAKATESLVSAHLMDWCHLEGTNRYGLALFFNGLDKISKSIEFCDTLLANRQLEVGGLYYEIITQLVIS